jgi:hypothetical protein
MLEKGIGQEGWYDIVETVSWHAPSAKPTLVLMGSNPIAIG